MKNKPKILFMCVANSCRSQMAEALGKHHLGDRFEIHSAGSVPTTPNPTAIEVLQEIGVDTSYLRSKSFDDVPKELDYAISLCEEQELSCPVFPANVAKLSWAQVDPAGKSIDHFRQVRNQIEQKIVEFGKTDSH